jgi:hypothetical protein
MLSFTYKPIMLSVVMLNVVMLRAVAPLWAPTWLLYWAVDTLPPQTPSLPAASTRLTARGASMGKLAGGLQALAQFNQTF